MPVSYTHLICLYFDRSERVFDSSGGMYTYSDFYNPDFLQILSEMDTEEAWVCLLYTSRCV